MPTTCQVLDLLTRDELLRLVERLGVIVGDRRVKAHLVERLDEEAPPLPDLLADLSHDRLKEICRALGLDDAGKEKAALLDRIAGGAKTPSAPPPKTKGPGRANAWRDALERILTEHTLVPYAYGDVKTEVVFDRKHDRYLLVDVGWEGYERAHGARAGRRL